MNTVQLNLLPDVKKEFVGSQKKKSLVIVLSVVVSVVAVVLVALLFTYTSVVQQGHIDNLQDDIDQTQSSLEAKPEIDKILTIQNQLLSLPQLYADKPNAPLVSDYLVTLVPNDVELNDVQVDFSSNSMVITGTGKDFKTVNTFADTIKNAQYAANDIEDTNAFSNVRLVSIGKDDEASSFEITAAFDPNIFDNQLDNLKLSVPNITSTQSEVNRPDALFNDELTP